MFYANMYPGGLREYCWTFHSSLSVVCDKVGTHITKFGGKICHFLITYKYDVTRDASDKELIFQFLGSV